MRRNKLFVLLIAVCLLLSSCAMQKGSKESTSDSSDAVNSTMLQPTSDDNSLENNFSENTTVPNPEQLGGDVSVNQSPSGRCFYGKATGTSLTHTGLEPLEKVNFRLSDMGNSKGLSKEMLSHGYGVASGEKPHEVSIVNQKTFDDKGFDSVCLDTKTTEKVIYLTFDCGYENGYTAKILDVLKEKNVPAAFFCTLPQMRDNPEIIARMINEGHIVGNHSVTHPDFSTLTKEQIIEEVKGFDDYIRENFGYSSLYFRYPMGKYSDFSTDALNELGFRCVFWSLAYADWDLENQKGADYAKETVISRIHPGAVILLHAVSPDNANGLADIIDTARSMGYEFRSLDDM